ncbi:DUF6647 family protein [Acuticoccus kandeliae]|uniref:DUF6647 family protein n=1 Tax=Acuticoccus kandeliae TaxID=2073160 RepID=UPI000D3E61F5|nr:DUF6647 family protein [Acuticoccus kandeliae]
MQDLLATIISWIAITADLPAAEQHPKIAFVASAEIGAIRSAIVQRTASGAAPMRNTTPAPSVYAFYDEQSGTIYLPDTWSETSPADVSILVHETVHHLQSLAGSKYACPAARERQAYEAQARWLAMFEMEIHEAFEIGPMAMLFLTRCVPP